MKRQDESPPGNEHRMWPALLMTALLLLVLATALAAALYA
jgi:hypothetical protein